MDVYVNPFDLLGDDECDISVLYKRTKVQQEATPPTSADAPVDRPEEESKEKEEVKEGENVEEKENGEENEWITITKKVSRKNNQRNGDDEKTMKGNDDNGQGNRGVERVNSSDKLTNMNNRGDKRRSKGGLGKFYVKAKQCTNNAANGNDSPTHNPEGDAVVVKSSNGEEVGEKETTDEVNGGVPVREETEEEKKERLKREKDEENRRKWREDNLEKSRKKKEEKAEEAKKMTLADYEKNIWKKKQEELELLTRKEEATRVVAADKDLENMRLVAKKQLPEEVLIVEREKPKGKSVRAGKSVIANSSSEESLKKSDSFEKKDRNPVAAVVAKIFRYGGGVRGRDRDYGNQVNIDSKSLSGDTPKTVEFPKQYFPRLGELPTTREPAFEPTTPVENPLAQYVNHSVAPRGNFNGPRGNRPSGPFVGRNGGSRGGRYVPRGSRSDGGSRGGRSGPNRSAPAFAAAATTSTPSTSVKA